MLDFEVFFRYSLFFILYSAVLFSKSLKPRLSEDNHDSDQAVRINKVLKEDGLWFGENSIPPNSLNFPTKLNQRVQAVKGQETIHMRKGYTHASTERLVAWTGKQRVEPEKMATALMNQTHGLIQPLCASPIPTVTYNDHNTPRSRPPS